MTLSLPRVCVHLIHTVFYLSHLSLPLYSLWCYNKIYDLSMIYYFCFSLLRNDGSRSLNRHWITSATMWRVDCYFAVLKHVPCDLQNSVLFLGSVPLMSCMTTYVTSLFWLLFNLLCVLPWDLKVLGNIVMDEGILSSLWIEDPLQKTCCSANVMTVIQLK